jgi:hypothetical protein
MAIQQEKWEVRLSTEELVSIFHALKVASEYCSCVAKNSKHIGRVEEYKKKSDEYRKVRRKVFMML